MSDIKLEEVKTVIKTLLKKAGKDPRLTPRILRTKAEQRLQLQQGALKDNREKIKDIIYEWWKEDQKEINDKIELQMRLLAKLAKVSGQTQIFKGIKELDSNAERVKILIERLREKGLQFSDTPTAEEIEKAKVDHEKKKELEGIDTNLIIEGNRKRPLPTGGEDAVQAVTIKVEHDHVNKKSTGNGGAIASSTAILPPVIKAKKVIVEDSDEEAEADL